MTNWTAWRARSAASRVDDQALLNPSETWLSAGCASTTKLRSCLRPASARHAPWSWLLLRRPMSIAVPVPRTPGRGLRDGHLLPINGKHEHEYDPRFQKPLPATSDG